MGATELDRVREFYRINEPAGTDAWNPLLSQKELWHRFRLRQTFCRALQMFTRQPAKLKALDVGCGTGRSTAMLVEFGVAASMVVGYDVRESAIATAKATNGTIRWTTRALWDDDCPTAERFDLVTVCTAFSSMVRQLRMEPAAGIRRVLSSVGFVFIFDRLTALPPFGGDGLDVAEMFGDMWLMYQERVSIGPRWADMATYSRIVRYLDEESTHFAALLG